MKETKNMTSKQEELIEQATARIKSEPCWQYTPKDLEQAIIEGLRDGDEINMGMAKGGWLIATLKGAVIELAVNDTVVKTVPIADLTEAQADAMLIRKGTQRSRKGFAMGQINKL